MNRNTLFSILATAAFGIVMAGPASATDFVWDGGGNGLDWSDAKNWDLNSGYPDDNGDKATLRGDTTIDVDVDVTIGELVIEDDAALDVDAAIGTRVLTIDDDAGAQNGKLTIEAGGVLNIYDKGQVTLDGTTTHDIGGDVKLRESGATLKFADSVTVDGAGNIIGQDDSAKILIVGGKTLTNEMVIRGRMRIDDPIGATVGIFLNGSTGVVRANATGTLLFATGLKLDDDCGAQWESSEANGSSTLKFESTVVFVDSNPELRGDFVLSNCGTIDFDSTTFKTSGSFSSSPVGNILNSGATFSYLNTGTCTDPTTYTDVSGDKCYSGPGCSCP